MHFETSKTEAILFCRNMAQRRRDCAMRVGDQVVSFAPDATRWLDIWLDSSLTLAEN